MCEWALAHGRVPIRQSQPRSRMRISPSCLCCLKVLSITLSSIHFNFLHVFLFPPALVFCLSNEYLTLSEILFTELLSGDQTKRRKD